MTSVQHILVVEDDENDVLFLEHAFRKAGCDSPLHVVVDGEQAIEYLSGTGNYTDRTQHPIPSMVLLDLNLPRKNGFEVLQWLRNSSNVHRIPVVVFTSSQRQGDIDTAYSLGASSVVAKPSSVERRVEWARLIKEYWLEFNASPGDCRPPL